MSNFFNFLCCLGKRDKNSKLTFLDDEANKIEDAHFINNDPQGFEDILGTNNDSSHHYFGSHPDLFPKDKHEEEKVPSQSTLSTQNLKKSQVGKKKRESRAWTLEEDNLLKKYYKLCGGKWKEIEKHIPNRTMTQCCQRWRRIKPFKTRKPWEPCEDEMVLKMVTESGANWQLIAKRMNGRTGKQVRDRYINILDPSINRDPWSEEEDSTIYMYYQQIGPFWSEISKHLQGRPENMVKNRFYSHIKKKMNLNVEDPSERNTDQQSMFSESGWQQVSEGGMGMEYLSNTSHIFENGQILGKSMLMDLETAMGEGFKIKEDPEEEPNPFTDGQNQFCQDFWRDDNSQLSQGKREMEVENFLGES